MSQRIFSWELERGEAPWWFQVFLPFVAVVITFILVAGLIRLAGAGVWAAYYYVLVHPFTSRLAFSEVLVKATPLLLTGSAVALAFTAGYFNIGAEGQLYAGAVAATWAGMLLSGQPAVVAVPAVALAGAFGGALWAGLPACLKARLEVDEVVSTLLLNPVILFLVGALVNGPWRHPVSLWPQSPDIAEAARFPRVWPGTRLHLGFLLAVGVLAASWWLVFRTGFGLRMRALGRGREAARFLGVPVARVTLQAALLSGAVAGLAGAGEVAGLHYHLIEALSPGYGYTGIVVATLAGLHPLGVGLAAFFVGLVNMGALTVSRALGVPAYLGDVIQGALLLVTLAVLLLRFYRVRWRP